MDGVDVPHGAAARRAGAAAGRVAEVAAADQVAEFQRCAGAAFELA